ncbi:ferredoxin--NADP reductase [Pseudobacteriovorax antillogorgiicola]|uniref:Ferredoxin-NADP reductase n=1 Tax=Pseudobacteriovorax antillogorgiicola TaxID=1513793 RepID=A0A1Y6BRJ2_9BACT|nr:FAD-dependent oxidoreductase [Pseudobacteriovorax antillogorgiicola]TCS53826.1 ferredoxin-NADP reductase [Pseudobacteriovorax antillogorgiicola]SMF21818.1 Ferredoxin-NADP reductase [Pseudobacteriovorax antillogorgiicola]
MTEKQTIIATISSKAELGPYTLLELKTPSSYLQNPGQYCMAHYKVGETVITRPYSIASEPRDDQTLELCVSHAGDPDTAQAIKNLKAGDTLDISPAAGRFAIPDHDVAAVFIAGGSGITPLRSMIRWRLPRTQQATTLLYGCQSPEEVPYLEDFLTLSSQHPHFTLKVYADQKGPSVGQGHALSDLDQYVALDQHYFLCGPPDMVQAAKTSLSDSGINDRQIHTDRY